MTAIDISRYRGQPDFAAVRASVVSLVLAKMGGADGGVYTDRDWATNEYGIRSAGLGLGAYFFNGPGASPTACADYMWAGLNYNPGDLVVIDVEGSGFAWSPAQVLTFLSQMNNHGVRVADLGVYLSASPERSQDWSAVAAFGAFLWVASYGSNSGTPGTPPVPAHWGSWAMWQYTSNGSIPGIAGRVDLSEIAPGFPVPPTPKEITNMSRILNIESADGAHVKLGEYYYWPEGCTYPVGPLSGTETTFGDIYRLNTIEGIPITKIGGGTYEAYAAERVAMADAYSASHGGVSGGPSASAIAAAVDTQLAPRFAAVPTAAQNAEASRSAIVAP